MPKGKTPYEKELAMRRREKLSEERSRKEREACKLHGKRRRTEILYEGGHYRFKGIRV